MLQHISYIAADAEGRACEVPVACLHLRVTVEDPEPKAGQGALRRVVACGPCRRLLVKLRERDAATARALDELRSLSGGAR